jgi:hypothetical protein
VTVENRLLQQLESATDNAERAALLGAASPQELTRLRGELAYRALMAEASAALAAFDTFTEALASAPDDEARLKVIAEAEAEHGADWLAGWAWWCTATPIEASARYQDLVR